MMRAMDFSLTPLALATLWERVELPTRRTACGWGIDREWVSEKEPSQVGGLMKSTESERYAFSPDRLR